MNAAANIDRFLEAECVYAADSVTAEEPNCSQRPTCLVRNLERPGEGSLYVAFEV